MFHAKTAAAAAALIAVMAGPLLADVEKVARVDVSVDISAVNDAQAATFWANLETDLENALVAKLAGRLPLKEAKPDDDGKIDGAQIMVDIREVELASAFERELNLGDAVLVGDVTIRDDTNMANTDTYSLSVSLENAHVVAPEGVTVLLSTDTTGAYNRLVEAFAEGVVSRLK
ncbi:hypothetical protein [Tabrizicola sp.]|uniref:hypothetical protein n=1 Tax=Tabrizicola sp. TaxID=2005166 RepID=UPI002FDCA727